MLVVKNPPANAGRRHKRHGFNPWVGTLPWRRAWQPTPVFWPGEFHGQRSLEGYSPWGHKVSETTQATWHAAFLNCFSNLLARNWVWGPGRARCAGGYRNLTWKGLKESGPSWQKKKTISCNHFPVLVTGEQAVSPSPFSI